MNVKTSVRSFVTVVAACFVAAALAVVLSAQSAFAANTYVMDRVGVLTPNEQADYEAHAKAISDRSGVGTYLVYVDNIGGSNVRSFAKNIYTSEGLGLGDNHSGILFLVAVNSRDYVTITFGNGVNAFTDDYIGKLEDDVVDQLKNNQWSKAAAAYLSDADVALTYYAEHGEPYAEPKSLAVCILIGLAVGILVAFFITRSDAAKMKTAQIAYQADDYLDRGTFVLTESADDYLGTTVICIKTHAQKEAERAARSRSTVDSGGFGGSSGGKF